MTELFNTPEADSSQTEDYPNIHNMPELADTMAEENLLAFADMQLNNGLSTPLTQAAIDQLWGVGYTFTSLPNGHIIATK